MSQTQEPISTPKEMGLVKHLSTRNRQLDWKQQANKTARLTAIKMFLTCDRIGEMAGQYVMECGGFFAPRKTMTYIADYTNKKGVTNKHHFNPNGNFVGSVKKLGEVPVECDYNCLITEEWISALELSAQYDLTKCDGVSIPRKERLTDRVRASDLIIAVPVVSKGKVIKVKKVKRKAKGKAKLGQ